MTRARVAFVVMDVGPVGGMERQATEVLRGLVDEGHDVTVVSRTCDLGGLGVRWKRIRTPRRPFSLAFPVWVLWASFVLARLKVDLVHVNGGIVLNKADVVTVHFCHAAYQAQFDLDERASAGRWHRLNARLVSAMVLALERWCLRASRVRRVIGISDGVAREVATSFPSLTERITVIPYGVDRDRFRPDPPARARERDRLGLADGAPLAVFVGGEWQRKGLRHVIEALAAAPTWHLVVAGLGDKERHQRLAEQHASADRVHFVGLVDPAGLYAAGDAFVFPTAYETFSLVTHEAAAAALPLLVTPVSGPDALVEPGINGWFIARSADDIARRLVQLEADPAARRRMGGAARRSTSHLTWDAARFAHLQLYRDLVEASGRGSSQ